MKKWEFANSLYDEMESRFDFEGYDDLYKLQNYLDSPRYYGFKFFDPMDLDSAQSSFVIIPFGRRLNFSDIYRRLRKLEVRNPHQIEAIKSWEFIILSEMIEGGV